MTRLRNPRDFCGGLLLAIVGLLALVGARGYPSGSAARMGPGYFPDLLGGLLVVIGAAIMLSALRHDGPPLRRWPWRPTVVVLGAVVMFGAVVPWLGLALSTVLLVFAASAASHEFRWREALVSGVALAILAVLVFVVGLKIQLPTWPAFVG